MINPDGAQNVRDWLQEYPQEVIDMLLANDGQDID
jgi:hypothetical protein